MNADQKWAVATTRHGADRRDESRPTGLVSTASQRGWGSGDVTKNPNVQKLEYAPPAKGTGAASLSTVGIGSAVLAWIAVIAACAFGIFWAAFMFPVLSLLAVWFGFIGRQAAGPGPSSDRARAGAAFWIGAIQFCLFAIALLILPSMGRAREPANRVKCASNLRQIGQGIQMYANEHGGIFPPSLDVVLSSQDLTSEVFICPSSNHERAAGATTQAVVANFRADPLHCSYVYTGVGLTSATATPAHVLAYEQATNHNHKGMNVLYGDGTVRWLDAKPSAHLLSELTAGRNPPR